MNILAGIIYTQSMKQLSSMTTDITLPPLGTSYSASRSRSMRLMKRGPTVKRNMRPSPLIARLEARAIM